MSLPFIMTVFQDVLARLEEAKIPYMVVGSLSSKEDIPLERL